jgi:viroplasmin and RNaseH domain-containing protein
MENRKFYAVWQGYTIGIFQYWEKKNDNPDHPKDTESIEYAINSVNKFPDSQYHSYKTFEDAKEKLETELEKQGKKRPFKYHNHDLKSDLPELW